MMESTILDALVCLAEMGFEDDDLAWALNPGHACKDTLVQALGQAGFSPCIAEETWVWLLGLTMSRDGWIAQAMETSRRVYTPWEARVLGADCQAYLEELESLGILDPPHRELVIDRALALHQLDLEPDELRWVVFYVLQGEIDDEADLPFSSWLSSDFGARSNCLH